LAWLSDALPFHWLSPNAKCLKSNFNVAIHDNFAVTTAVISNFSGKVIFAVTQKLYVSIVLIGEAVAALLATWLAAFTCIRDFMLEGDALLVILVVKQPHLFSS
jgi:hypothetical protein